MIPVLYVDDESSLLELGKRLLEKEGDLRVVTAESVQEGLTMLSRDRFEAIISDFQIPAMDGIGFLNAIRKKGLKIPFIIYTGKGNERAAIDALNCGADFYLQKNGNPVSQFAEIRHTIISAVDQTRTAKAAMQEQLRLGQFIENSSQPVIVLDQNGVVIFANRKCMELLGYDQEEITRKRWVDLCKNPVSCQEAFYQLVREPDLPGSAGVHHQNEIVTKGGIC